MRPLKSKSRICQVSDQQPLKNYGKQVSTNFSLLQSCHLQILLNKQNLARLSQVKSSTLQRKWPTSEDSFPVLPFSIDDEKSKNSHPRFNPLTISSAVVLKHKLLSRFTEHSVLERHRSDTNSLSIAQCQSKTVVLTEMYSTSIQKTRSGLRESHKWLVAMALTQMRS